MSVELVESRGNNVEVLDGGPCPVGIESTVVDLCGERSRLLRPGAVTLEQLRAELGEVEIGADEARPSSPGQLASHYAPDRPLRLNATEVRADEALLAFGPAPLTGALVTRNLSPSGDLIDE